MHIYLVSITVVLLSAVIIFKLAAKIRQNHRQLITLYNIDRSILSGLSHNGVMNAVVDKLMPLLKADGAAILTLNSYHNFKGVFTSNVSKNFKKNIKLENNSFLTSVIDNRKPLIISKISTDENEGFIGTIRNEGFMAYMSTPIIAKGGTPAGVLMLYSKKPKNYTRQQMNLVEAINSRIGMVLDRAQLIQRIQEINFESVRALVEAIELRDPYTIGHSIQVANLSVIIARELEFSERDLDLMEFAGLLHDIGKIIVPESILQKNGKLTSDEWKIIKMHATHSAKIIEPVRNLRSVQIWVLHHHEKWDGSGYPEGRKAEQIPLQSRILAVCDAYSAMTGNRPYRDALSEEEARDEITRVAGKQLDPKIVDIFLSLDIPGSAPEENSRRDKKAVAIS
ncbi:MAG: HD domain-containing phosphohydrolase [bacterium]